MAAREPGPQPEPLVEPESLVEPEPLHFLYDQPPVSERQLAIVKLVARRVAADAAFARAAEFDFTRVDHALHALFSALVEQYRRVGAGAQPPPAGVLARAVQRAQLAQREAPVRTESDSGADRAPGHAPPSASARAMPAVGSLAAIDWQDFVVLETVEFFAADLNGTSPLSAPLSREAAALHHAQPVRARGPLYKSPYTGEAVPAAQFDEHMRVHALGPTRRRPAEVSTNLDVTGAAANLARLQEKRRRLEDA